MTQAKHTPDLYLWRCDDGTYDICEHGETDEETGPVVYNVPGRVLLAAPDLLEGLEWALRYVRLSGTSEEAEEFSRQYNQARAAIAKATGDA